ncbi:TPA: tetratricopeptide repeat protein [Vibrio vulnificus]
MDDNILSKENRQLIPRWHTSKKTIKLNFPNEVKKTVLGSEGDYWLIKSVAEWQNDRNLTNAIDLYIRLIESDLAEHSLYPEVYNQLLTSLEELPEVVREFVIPNNLNSHSQGYSTDPSHIRLIIKKLKNNIANNPRDSWGWMDLGFYYSVLGELEKAEHHTSVARNLDSNNSFIARAYARYSIHSGKPELAEWHLRNNPYLKSDPMIFSAYMSVCNSYDVGRYNVSDARKLVNNWQGDLSRKSELLASIGTIEIKNGAINKGKKLINQALESPSENVISHVSWLNHKHKINFNQDLSENVSLEKNVNDLYSRGSFKECRDTLIKMYNFQPYSSGSISDAAYLSIIALNDLDFVKSTSDNRIPKSHMEFSELNNLIVAKILSGELDTIYQDIEFLRKKVDSSDTRIVGTFTATCGMLLLKMGEHDQGQRLYEDAIDIFQKQNDERALCVVKYFYSRMLEEVYRDKSLLIKADAVKLGKKLGMLEIK